MVEHGVKSPLSNGIWYDRIDKYLSGSGRSTGFKKLMLSFSPTEDTRIMYSLNTSGVKCISQHVSCSLQLTSAPKFLPPSLVSTDFAANHLTRIYPYTFGYKPKLR